MTTTAIWITTIIQAVCFLGIALVVLFWAWGVWVGLEKIGKELEKANTTLHTISDQLEGIDKNTTASPSDWEGA